MNEDTLDLVKAVYDDKCAEINGNEYKFIPTTHERRIKVFGYLTKITPQLELNDVSFLSSKEFKEIEKILFNMITFEDSLISKIPNHWDTEPYGRDYVKLVIIALQVVSYPLQ